jgi:mannose-1-phosphate guanylyltransferase
VIVCKSESSAQIDRFVEKPVEFISNRINAGIYLLSTDILDFIPLRPCSIEKEVFPKVAQAGGLYSHDLHGFWMDVGQPKDYIIGTALFLDSLEKKHPERLSKRAGIVGNVLIDETASIGKDCQIGPSVIIGPGVTIQDGVRLSRSTVMEGSTIKAHSCIHNSIIGCNCTVGSWVRIEGTSILGDDVTVGDEVYVNGGSILPHKAISCNVPEPKIIM